MGQHLGQHFLNSEKALKAIVASGNILPGDTILEIGPGKGVLTKELLRLAGKVIAVEKDSLLVESLEKNFDEQIKMGKLILHEGDIREFDISKYISKTDEYKLIANIPYYITGQILRMFLESDFMPRLLVLLMQKEVAERITAKNGKESILSISVKAFGNAEIIMKVPRGAFNPPPDVDSAILKITPNKTRIFNDKNEMLHFFEVLKAGFASPRKTISSNLRVWWPEKYEKVLSQLNIDPKTRAERLTVNDWQNISKALRSS